MGSCPDTDIDPWNLPTTFIPFGVGVLLPGLDAGILSKLR